MKVFKFVKFIHLETLLEDIETNPIINTTCSIGSIGQEVIIEFPVDLNESQVAELTRVVTSHVPREVFNYKFEKLVDLQKLREEVAVLSQPVKSVTLHNNIDINFYFNAELSPEDEDKLNEIIALHVSPKTEPEVILKGENRDEFGNLTFAQTFPYLYKTANIRKCYKFIAQPNSTTFFDILVTSEIRISGGNIWVRNPEDLTDEDYVEFSIIDKDDILGAFVLICSDCGTMRTPEEVMMPCKNCNSQNRMQVGQGVLELKKFVRTEYFIKSPGDTGKASFEPSSIHGDLIYKGLYMRPAVTTESATPLDIVVRISFYEE